MALNIIHVFCSRLLFFSWLQNHLLTCPFKYLTGLDCPGCGFQRALIALFQGDVSKSFALYPPTIPLLIVFTYGIFDAFFKLDNAKGIVKKSLFVVAASIILVSYSVKMTKLYRHYKTSVAAIAVK